MKPRLASRLIVAVFASINVLSAQQLVVTPSELSRDMDLQSPGQTVGSDTHLESPEEEEGNLEATEPLFLTQDSLNLKTRPLKNASAGSNKDLGGLRTVSAQLKPSSPAVAKARRKLAELSAAYRQSGNPEGSGECPTVALSVEQHILVDPSMVLEIVETEVGANPSCACEITKSAIRATEADAPMVVDIVETAISAAPEQMRIISQCAIATMPEATTAIQVLLNRLDPGRYQAHGSKDSKDAKDAESIEDIKPMDPLDIPDILIAPPSPFADLVRFPPLPPVMLPPAIISPPSATDVNPVGIPLKPPLILGGWN